MFVFEKIFLNSSDVITDLKLFDNADLEKLFNNLKINFYKDYLKKRKNILENIFFNKKVNIPELEWKIDLYNQKYKKNDIF